MKTCFKCGAFKPLGEFYAHPQMADGHLNKCKECTKFDVKLWAGATPELRRAYELRRNKTDSRKAARLNYLKQQRAKYPEKNRARAHVSYAIRTGNIKRQPCEACGSLKSQAHHEDYSRPLDVRWLCFPHHREADRKLRQILAAQ